MTTAGEEMRVDDAGPADERDVAAQVADRIAIVLGGADPADVEPARFLARQFDAGLAFVDFPEAAGGLGIPARWQRVVDDQLEQAGGPRAFPRNPLGVGMLPATLLRHGTPQQLQRFLRPAFTGEEVWCQLFSEPGAGSDLAGLATRAVRAGEQWLVTGQKVWTSLAHRAKWGMLLARTQPDLPKHQGITYFLIDMEQPGVEVRPLRQLNGASEFNEVFLRDAVVEDAHRVGSVGEGWRVAATTLSSERAALSGAGTGQANIGGSGISELIGLAQRTGRWEDVRDRDRVLDLYVESTLIRLTNQRNRAALRAGRSIGAEGSVTKLVAGQHNRRLQRALLDFWGPQGQAWTVDEPRTTGEKAALGYLRAQANTIEGGTSNVLRNVLAERVLGMPRDPGDVPRDTPWKDIPRG